MPWQGTLFAFNPQTVTASGASAGGVFALWRSNRWIYVGESSDVLARLLEYIRGADECISREAPTGFGFELIADAQQRAARRATLIQELMPVCNHP